jgi:maltooligosyltrehalose trehalohydrolase
VAFQERTTGSARSHALNGTDLPFGAQVLPGERTRFRLWAPSVEQAEVCVLGQAPQAMAKLADGWHEAVLAQTGAGSRYQYRLEGSALVPDPASRYNPLGVLGPSEVVDPSAYRWQDQDWHGRPWHETVLYELHVGAFTAEGTFAAAALRLPALAALGVTAIELMPLADTPGARNWGYDGVLLFAPAARYGPPDALRTFVDRAHAVGLMVLVDVVYNHFGPEGNQLHAYCPEFFDPAQQTPWGAAIAFEGPHRHAVRAFYVANALYWLQEFHCDGLRLDAVHQIRDRSDEPIVDEIARAMAEGPGRQRQLHLVLENERNEADRLAPQGIATAQWSDDWHHAAHVLLTGERDGYYADFAEAPAEQLGTALAQGFVYQGQMSRVHGAPRGQPSRALPPTAFVACLQNHDQIGNRALGERLDALVPTVRVQALLACLLLSPQIPLLFMGEEFAASTPFLYFCDYQGALADAVREGRRAEFGRFAAFADPAARARIPDPNARSTFDRSRLPWHEAGSSHHAARLALVGRLLALRHAQLVPRLPGLRAGESRGAGPVIQVTWPLAGGGHWALLANLQDAPAALPMALDGHSIYHSHPGAGDGPLPPWCVHIRILPT